MHQNLGAAQFCAAELICEAELEGSVSRLWLLALLHFCRAGHLAQLCRSLLFMPICKWLDVAKIDWTLTIFLSLDFLRRVSLTSQYAAIWTFYVCLKHLIKLALPGLISDENFMVRDRSGLLCDGAIEPFWFSPEVLK